MDVLALPSRGCIKNDLLPVELKAMNRVISVSVPDDYPSHVDTERIHSFKDLSGMAAFYYEAKCPGVRKITLPHCGAAMIVNKGAPEDIMFVDSIGTKSMELRERWMDNAVPELLSCGYTAKEASDIVAEINKIFNAKD